MFYRLERERKRHAGDFCHTFGMYMYLVSIRLLPDIPTNIMHASRMFMVRRIRMKKIRNTGKPSDSLGLTAPYNTRQEYSRTIDFWSSSLLALLSFIHICPHCSTHCFPCKGGVPDFPASSLPEHLMELTIGILEDRGTHIKSPTSMQTPSDKLYLSITICLWPFSI